MRDLTHDEREEIARDATLPQRSTTRPSRTRMKSDPSTEIDSPVAGIPMNEPPFVPVNLTTWANRSPSALS